MSKTPDFKVWTDEASKAVVEAVAGTHSHLMRGVLVEAFNLGVQAAAAVLPEAERAPVLAVKVSEGM